MSRISEEPDMRKSIKHYAVTIFIIFLILIINVMAYFQYSKNIDEQLSQQIDIHLQAVTDEMVECLDIKMEERLATFKAVATFIGTTDDIKSEFVEAALTKQAQAAGYSQFDVIMADGIGLQSKGSVDYNEDKCFAKAMAGKSVMEVKEDAYGAVNGINYYVPIYKYDAIVGVLLTTSDLVQFTNYMDISDLGQYGNVFVVKQDGTLLSRGYGLDEVENISMIFGNDKSATELVNSMQSRQSGYISYETESSKRYICYARTAYNKWYMVSIVSSSSIELASDDIANEGTVFFIEIGVLTLILTIYLVRVVFVESKGNKLNKTRYYMVSKYSDSIIFDYSCEKDTMYCNDKWKKIFGYDVERSNLKEDITRYIIEEDKERFKEIINVLMTQKEFVKFQISILDNDGKPISCSFKMSAIKGKKGKVQKVLGVIEVIQQNV